MSTKTAAHISEWFIRPKYEVQDAKKPYYLTPMDLTMFNFNYIQKGLMFNKPSHVNDREYSTPKLIESLRNSLSFTLIHFYPLAGQLATQINEDQHQCLIFIDCNKGPGVKFVYATLDMTISDILSPIDVPLVVESLFDHDRAVSHDGHERPLLSVQVTELADGVFIGCSMNHAVADGSSFWKFWNLWSKIHRANNCEPIPVSCLPIHDRWFPEGYGPKISLPFTHPDEFISRYQPCLLRQRFFHFSAESIARLKDKANKESKTDAISSFQSLSGLVWRSLVRANCLSHDQATSCRIPTNNRHRLNPPLHQNYFGNCITPAMIATTAGELLEHNLGWAASLLHQAVVNHNDQHVRKQMDHWMQSPSVFRREKQLDAFYVVMASSPRFDMYGNEFGLGKAVAVRGGYGNKFVGAVHSYPGYEGGGSVDLEICLPPNPMRNLESDNEFMDYVSPLNDESSQFKYQNENLSYLNSTQFV